MTHLHTFETRVLSLTDTVSSSVFSGTASTTISLRRPDKVVGMSVKCVDCYAVDATGTSYGSLYSLRLFPSFLTNHQQQWIALGTWAHPLPYPAYFEIDHFTNGTHSFTILTDLLAKPVPTTSGFEQAVTKLYINLTVEFVSLVDVTEIGSYPPSVRRMLVDAGPSYHQPLGKFSEPMNRWF